jgi:hypothetical protein
VDTNELELELTPDVEGQGQEDPDPEPTANENAETNVCETSLNNTDARFWPLPSLLVD